MARIGYILNKDPLPQKEWRRYSRTELERMTTHQLREICRTEKIMNGVLDPLDKDDLIRVIIRFRGIQEYNLIQKGSPEGIEALTNMLSGTKLQIQNSPYLESGPRVTLYEGLSLDFSDRLTIPYDSRFVGTNALIADRENQICAVVNLLQRGAEKDYLYLVKAEGLPCRETEEKNCRLLCFERPESDLLYKIYHVDHSYIPEHLNLFSLRLLDYAVREPVELSTPLAIDFGSSNTTAGLWLDGAWLDRTGMDAGRMELKRDRINYVPFPEDARAGTETAVLPSIAGILAVEQGEPQFVFGNEAMCLAQSGYLDDNFSIFYDIKRWVSDYERTEEVTDKEGRLLLLARKDIIRAFLLYVIRRAECRFKCRVKTVHISSPVKQRRLFQRLFEEVFQGDENRAVSLEPMEMDEGVSVLYDTISSIIANGEAKDGETVQALILDCGGGTTDLSSCAFRIRNRRVSYDIQIHTAYENGDTNFGGNNLTFRILQLLKLELTHRMAPGMVKAPEALLQAFDLDVFRAIDQFGVEKLYAEFDAEYQKAEAFLPTRFKEYGHRSRVDYYRVKNNYYFLFRLAEQVKRTFFDTAGTLKVLLTAKGTQLQDAVVLPVGKWGLHVLLDGQLESLKEIPDMTVGIYRLSMLLQGDVYHIIHQLLEHLYENDELFQYGMIRLTGQSCKMSLFREALKEFVPGRAIRSRRTEEQGEKQYELKLACLDGALQYLRDKKYGLANVKVHRDTPALPYSIRAYTHTGEERELIECRNREHHCGSISRNMEDLTLKLYLLDRKGETRCDYTYECALEEFSPTTQEEITSRYEGIILQDDTDDIEDGEVKFFVWERHEDLGFTVLPVLRRDKVLMSGREGFYLFENDSWVESFFDGTK